jgi:hypothetical protein
MSVIFARITLVSQEFGSKTETGCIQYTVQVTRLFYMTDLLTKWTSECLNLVVSNKERESDRD